MRVVISLIAVLAYWVLDAYKDVLNFKISFTQALLLDYDQASVLIKISISILIFTFLILKKSTQEPIDNFSSNKFTSNSVDVIYKISGITLSSQPLEKQLEAIVSALQNGLNSKSAFIGAFEKNSVRMLNKNLSSAELGIKEKYTFCSHNPQAQSLEVKIFSLYRGNEEFFDNIMPLESVEYRVILSVYKDVKTKANIGIVGIILDKNDSNDYIAFITALREYIAFLINFAEKKESAFRTQNIFNEHFALIDRELNIPTNSSLLQRMELEIRRSQRYGTLLSLIIIEIDYIKNISNILSEEEVILAKKEIASFLKKGVRDTDLFGKWVDNRFAIIAPDIDFRSARNFALKVNRNLNAHRFHKIGKITCSYGITSVASKDTVETLSKRAESALNEAIKDSGDSIEIKILL